LAVNVIFLTKGGKDGLRMWMQETQEKSQEEKEISLLGKRGAS